MKTTLSEYERAAVALVAEGLPNKEIAYRLGTSVDSIKQCVFRACNKTGASNRTELALWFRDGKL